MPDEELESLDWCKKCVNHVNKTRQIVNSKSLEVLFGVNAEMITIHCKRCDCTFQETYAKKIEQI